MKTKLIFLNLFISLTGFGQFPSRGPEIKSPEVLEDHSVILRLFAPEASSVQLAGSVLKDYRPLEMEKNNEGIFEIKVGPLESDMYVYTFKVNGVTALDPNNPVTIRDGAHIESRLIIDGETANHYDAKDVKHGKVSSVWYDSKTIGVKRRMLVYTPPGYDDSQDQYPILYLLHGGGGDEEAWISRGRANYIMDNLVDQNKAIPMIIVMTNGSINTEAAPDQRPYDSFKTNSNQGYLTCCKCGANLTGSASRSKTGKRHYYYHCNSKFGCNERFRVSLADLKLQEYLYQLKPKKNVLNLFKLIYKDTWGKNKDITLRESNRINTDIINLESNQEALLNKLLEGVIDNELFKQQNNKIQAKINQYRQELENIASLNDDILDRVNQAADLFFNLSQAYEKADTKLKRKLLSSIFEEKLIFENENYRTPKFNPAFNEIYTNMKKLEGFEIKKGDTFESISRGVVRTGIEPVFRP
ncbi:MAG: hypothetical protein RIR51_1189 [Bacteroidota bacterium]